MALRVRWGIVHVEAALNSRRGEPVNGLYRLGMRKYVSNIASPTSMTRS